MIAKPSFSRAMALGGGGALTATAVGATLAPGGAIKSGSQFLNNSSTPVQVTSFTVDPTYPATTITSSGIVISGGGTATVTVQLTSSTTNTANWGVHIRKNGVQVGPEYTPGGTVTAPFGGSFSTTVANGDVLTMWAWTTASTSNRREIDATTTWFKVTP